SECVSGFIEECARTRVVLVFTTPSTVLPLQLPLGALHFLAPVKLVRQWLQFPKRRSCAFELASSREAVRHCEPRVQTIRGRVSRLRLRLRFVARSNGHFVTGRVV